MFPALGLILLASPQEEPAVRLKVGEHPVRSVAFLPDGKRLLAGSGPAGIWDLSNGKELRRLENLDGNGGVWILRLSADGRVVVGHEDSGRQVASWNAATGKETARIREEVKFFHLSVSPDGTRALVAGNGIGLYDTATLLKKPVRFEPAPETVHSASFSPDGRSLAIAEAESVVRIRDVATGEVLRTLAAAEPEPMALAYSPDGSLLCVASESGGVSLWDLRTGESRGRLSGSAALLEMAFTPDGRLLVMLDLDGGLSAVETASGTVVRSLAKGLESATSLAVAPDGARLAVGRAGGEVLVWKTLPDVKPLEDDEVAGTWDALSGPPDRAFEALLRLGATHRAAEALAGRLLAVPPPKEVEAVLAGLESPEIQVREDAVRRLEGLLHDPGVAKALETSASAEARSRVKHLLQARAGRPLRQAEALRRWRAVWAIERAGGMAQLEALSKGGDAAIQTVEARRALERLRGNRK